jgi:hypothetical protein
MWEAGLDSCIDGCLCRRIAEFEARSLSLQHTESWYMAKIWTMIDRVIADVDDLEAVR